MLLQVILAFCATRVFYRHAKRRGIHPGKASAYPFVCLGVLFLFARMISMGVHWVLAETRMAESASYFELGTQGFVFLAYLILIGRSWRRLQQLPTPPTNA